MVSAPEAAGRRQLGWLGLWLLTPSAVRIAAEPRELYVEARVRD